MYRLAAIAVLAASITNVAVYIRNGRVRAELAKMIEHNRQLEKENKHKELDLSLRESILEKKEALKRACEPEFELPDLHEARKYGAVKSHTPRRIAQVIPGTRTVVKDELFTGGILLEYEERIVIQAVLDGELIDVEEWNKRRKHLNPHDGTAASA